MVRPVQIPAPDSSVEHQTLVQIQGGQVESWSGVSLFPPSYYIGLWPTPTVAGTDI